MQNHKEEYNRCHRHAKKDVAFDIVRKWRDQSPPGRFLESKGKGKEWQEVGDDKARKKTSQALREKQSVLIQRQRGERGTFSEHLSEDDDGSSSESSESSDEDVLPEVRIAKHSVWSICIIDEDLANPELLQFFLGGPVC